MSKVPNLLNLTCSFEDIQLEAAQSENGPRKFKMHAYTGAAMSLYGWEEPVVIDLSGVQKTRGKKPILLDHDRTQRVGHSDEVSINGADMHVAGVISGAGAAAQEVVQSSLNGFPWQASVGMSVKRAVLVKAGQTVKVNGNEHVGPLYVVRSAQLNEISFVPLGADDSTSATVAASAASNLEAYSMEFEKWVEALGFDPKTLDDKQRKSLQAQFDAQQTPPPVDPTVQAGAKVADDEEDSIPDPAAAIKALRAAHADEAKRIIAVQKAAKDFPDICATAVAEGWDENRTELEVLRESRPKPPAIHAGRGGSGAGNGLVLEAAVCMTGRLNALEKDYKPEVLEAAHKRFPNGIGLQQLLLEAAWEGGYTGRYFRDNPREVLKAAFSTLSLPGIFTNVANKMLLESFMYVESVWREIVTITSHTDFRPYASYRLNGNMEYERLPPGGEIKHGSLGEESYASQLETYAKMFAIDRTQIINDDLNALTQVPRMLGRGAALALNKKIWTEFLDDDAFFTTGNLNYAEGAATALSITSLTQFEQMFRDLLDPDGNPMALAPEILLVPTALAVTATQLMNTTEVRDTTASTKYLTSNPHAGKFRVISSAYLNNANIPGGSATAWYLLANPNTLPILEVSFLNGQQSPTIETAEVDFNQLGIQMRGYHDFDATKQDYRAGVKSKGAT
jgi:hypothetical protein